MEAQALAQAWQKVEALMETRFGKKPNMEAVLFLIGVNEFGQAPPRGKFTKEQKQDLMHIAVCTLLAQKGYYRFAGRDAEGWPHFDQIEKVPEAGLPAQEDLLKECVVEYFGMNQ